MHDLETAVHICNFVCGYSKIGKTSSFLLSFRQVTTPNTGRTKKDSLSLCVVGGLPYLCTNMTTYPLLWHRLLPLYDADEAQSIVRWLLDACFGLSLTDIVCGKVEQLPADDAHRLEGLMLRLEQGEPVQYVVGEAPFGGRSFHVEPGVLIPRPETEELCRRIVAANSRPYCGLQPPRPLDVLDVGTGSGCIACPLALDLSPVSVSAWDLSPDALLVARTNAHRLQAEVNLSCRDALLAACEAEGRGETGRWDIIVSNPPYIAEREQADMRPNVLRYEPRMALFVPDDDPLRFYRAIAQYARRTLRGQGQLWFEINPLFAAPLERMLAEQGFDQVDILCDQFGRKRFAKALQPCDRPGNHTNHP